jgi:hypothetical protein
VADNGFRASSHWLIPPAPALMGLRAPPGVPAVGHTLDPRSCPACAPTRTKVPAPAPAPESLGPSTLAKLVVAAAALSTSTRRRVAVSDLVVRAWQLYPESFGLRGYESIYPDANKVLSKLFGVEGAVARGYLRRVSTGVYAATTAGLAHARATATRRAA